MAVLPLARRAPPRRAPIACAMLMACALLALVPGAAAETVVFDTVHVRLAPDAFDAELADQAVVDDRARALRAYIDDEHGDGDGIVTSEEYEAYRAAEIADFNSQLGNPIATGLFGDLKVAGRGARSIEVTDVTLSENVIGSTADNDTVHRSVSARLLFRAPDASRVNISFEQDFRVPFRIIEMEWHTAHFTGAGDWAIDPGTFRPKDTSEFWADGALVVPYERTGDLSNRSHHMRFDLVDTTVEEVSSGKEDKGSPAPAAALLVPALGLVAAALRRRHQS